VALARSSNAAATGPSWNHNRVYRVYCLLELNKRRKGQRLFPRRLPEPLVASTVVNCCWSMNFVIDTPMCGRRFHTFNIIDDFCQNAPAIEIDLNLPEPHVIRVLKRVALFQSYPEKLRVDNGPNFNSLALADWPEEHDVTLDFLQPRKPIQNLFID